ncbi:unnamed protein product [Prunus armeniaca]
MMDNLVNKGQHSWPPADGGRPTVVVASGRGRWRPTTGEGGWWAVGDGCDCGHRWPAVAVGRMWTLT